MDGAQWHGEVQNKDVSDSGWAVKTQTFPATEQQETPSPNLLTSLLPDIQVWFMSSLPFCSFFTTLCHPCSNSQTAGLILKCTLTCVASAMITLSTIAHILLDDVILAKGSIPHFENISCHWDMKLLFSGSLFLFQSYEASFLMRHLPEASR